jgi:hypothetical protein
MRIGINALFLQKPATGMGQHLLHLLEGLDSLDEKDQQYMLLAPRCFNTQKASMSRFRFLRGSRSPRARPNGALPTPRRRRARWS